MIEVISSLAQLEGYSLDKIIEVAKIKSKKRGSFKQKIFLENVIKKS